MRRVLHIIAWMHARLGARPLFGTFGILQALDRAGAGYGTHKVTVCAGDRVLLDTRAAKHDPAVFPRPDRFDITRHGRAHLSFGHGARYCLGAPPGSNRRRCSLSCGCAFHAMRLAAPPGQFRMRSGSVTGGLTRLPVAW